MLAHSSGGGTEADHYLNLRPEPASLSWRYLNLRVEFIP